MSVPAPDRLDASQRAASRTEAPRVLVLAGAGSGKTRTLVARVEHLVRERDVPPERILLATFTQRAAAQMREQAERRLGPRARRLQAGTFHALALAALRRHGSTLGLAPDFILVARDERRALLGEALAGAGVDPRGRPGLTPDRFERLLGRAQNDERELAGVLLDEAPELAMIAPLLDDAAERYSTAKARLHALDFDDLLVLWRALLDPDRPSAVEITSGLDHVLVDEYQDTTPIQDGLAEDLAQRAHLFVVGDDAQSIYGFRGARFDNILEFPTRAPTEVHRLVTSYRSRPAVVALARAALERNPLQFPKPLTSAFEDGPPVELLRGEDERDEARRVAARARSLAERDGVPYDAQAILLRRHRDADAIELALAEARVPYALRAGRRFLDRPHVAAALAYLRLLHRVDDVFAWRRILALWPGVGPRTVATLIEAISEEVRGGAGLRSILLADRVRAATPARARAGLSRLARLLGHLEAASRDGAGAVFASLLERDDGILPLLAQADDPDLALEDLEQLRATIGEADPSAAVEELGLSGDSPAERAGGLCLSTIHAAKGLQWRAVFVVGLADGRFPVSAALRGVDGEAEERRLFYVAVTRAAERLILSRPAHAASDRGLQPLDPSRFVAELPPELYSIAD